MPRTQLNATMISPFFKDSSVLWGNLLQYMCTPGKYQRYGTGVNANVSWGEATSVICLCFLSGNGKSARVWWPLWVILHLTELVLQHVKLKLVSLYYCVSLQRHLKTFHCLCHHYRRQILCLSLAIKNLGTFWTIGRNTGFGSFDHLRIWGLLNLKCEFNYSIILYSLKAGATK